jgi:hypothetical protein
VVCLGRTIETILSVAIANDSVLSVSAIVLGVRVLGVEEVEGLADKCSGEEIAGSLNALRFFYSFLSYRNSK